jgi:hypothetical protein
MVAILGNPGVFNHNGDSIIGDAVVGGHQNKDISARPERKSESLVTFLNTVYDVKVYFVYLNQKDGKTCS